MIVLRGSCTRCGIYKDFVATAHPDGTATLEVQPEEMILACGHRDANGPTMDWATLVDGKVVAVELDSESDYTPEPTGMLALGENRK